MFRKVIILLFCSIISTNLAISQKVKLGIDVLEESNFELIKGKRVGLLTNQSGRNSSGRLTAEILAKSDSFRLTAIFTPEHGLYGAAPAGALVANDSFMNVSVYSLYGTSKNPNPKHIRMCDIILVDIQDIGVRSYTFLSTMIYLIRAAVEQNVEVLILDRPNPLGGLIVDGGTVDKGRETIVSLLPVSYIHGLTFGELALMAVGEGWLNSNKKSNKLLSLVNIVKMQGWSRDMEYEDTGLMWFPTSPHIPSVDAIRGAAMIGVFGELGIINIGIGTTLPFQYIGGPSLDASNVLASFTKDSLYGLYPVEAKFKPFYAKYANTYCNGILLKFNYDRRFLPYSWGIKLFLAVRNHHPELFEAKQVSKSGRDMFKKVTGGDDLFDAFFGGKSDDDVLISSNKGLEKFKVLRLKYLLYN